MMLILWCFRWLVFHLIIAQCAVQYTGASWTSSNFSTINLLGLFPDVLNTSTPTIFSVHSRAMFKAAILLSQQYNITIEGQFIGWQSVQTGGDAMNALGNTCQSISTSNIVGIVGPALSRESLVIAPFGAKIGIPVISYASTDPELSDGNIYPAFHRTVPSDNTAALAIANLFMQFNWTSCVVIYQNDAFGSGGATVISDTFNQNNLIVTQMIIFDIVALTIRGDLKSLLANSLTRIVLVWADPNYESLILQNALDSDVLGPQFTWILSSNVPWNNFNKTSYEKLSGILTVEPVVGNVVNAPINTTLLNAAYQIWQQYEPESFPGSDNVDYYALFAFDATWLLIQSLKQLCSPTSNISSSCLSSTNDSFCFNRRFLNSKLFFNIIDNTSFLGVSGPIQFGRNITDRIDGNYYIVKNVQRSSTSLNSVPVLIWSDSGGWTSYTRANMIIWPGNSLVVPTGYAALSGVNLRIAVVESAPFTMVEEITDDSGQITTKLIGYLPDLITNLEDQLGFTANITIFSSNQSYNGLIAIIANGTFDMMIADTTITSTRREIVAFSSPIFDNSLRVIVRDESITSIDFWSYLKPFSPQLWLTLFAATIYAGILICILERQKNEALRDRSVISSISMSMWYSIGTTLGYGVDFDVTTAAGRLLTIGLYILSLILVAAYTANLASDLSILKSKGIISGIDDIKNGKVPYSRIGILTGSSIEDYYLREISGGSRNFYPLNSKDEIFSLLLNKTIDASIMDSGVLEYETSSTYCNLTLPGTDFAQSAFGIVFRKNWLYEKDLDVAILSIREAGTFDTLKTKWFQTNGCSSSSDISTAMTIESMAGLFLTFVIISILAVLLFAWTKRFIIKKYLLTLEHIKRIL